MLRLLVMCMVWHFCGWNFGGLCVSDLVRGSRGPRGPRSHFVSKSIESPPAK